MFARIITITSGKGGVGKTTTTANLAVALARRGLRIACLDADIGLRNLDVVMGLESRIAYDLVDVVEGRARLHQALIQDQRLPELYLLPAAQSRDKTAVNESQMIRLCEELGREFDYILIDSPAGIEHGFRNAIAPAHEALIVTTPEVSAVRDADRIIGMIEAAQKPTPRLILNRLRSGMIRRGDMLDTPDVLEVLAIDLIGIIPEDEAIITSTNKGTPVTLEDRTPSGAAFTRVARRLLGEEVPFVSFDGSMGLLDRVSRLFGR